jgi:hypothetical protein
MLPPWYHGGVKSIGSGTLGDLVGDLVAYRSLRPCDQRLGDFAVPLVPPRKIERAYGQIVGDLLGRARALDAPRTPLRRIVMVGDNAQTDGAAFETLCAVNGWHGTVLLVQEHADAIGDVPAFTSTDPVVHLRHWIHLLHWADAAGALDQYTVVLLDIDKTLLGARGRNDVVIDDARSAAMRDTIAALLGATFDQATFSAARQTFNDRRFHPLTGDNQDYVAFICLLLGAGVWSSEALKREIEDGRIANIRALAVRAMDAPLAAEIRAEVAGIVERIETGDPTPFKAFRAKEFYETVARMGLGDALPIEERLRTELVLTGEVIAVAERWREQGALLFALSDKPDEAAVPPADDRATLPLHHVRTHIVSS